jgi:hypothetical protein
MLQGWLILLLRDGKVKREMILCTGSKKLQHLVLFFKAEKRAVRCPRLPRIPPQTHHKSTTRCTRFFAKTPAKTALHHNQEKVTGNPPKSPSEQG